MYLNSNIVYFWLVPATASAQHYNSFINCSLCVKSILLCAKCGPFFIPRLLEGLIKGFKFSVPLRWFYLFSRLLRHSKIAIPSSQFAFLVHHTDSNCIRIRSFHHIRVSIVPQRYSETLVSIREVSFMVCTIKY